MSADKRPEDLLEYFLNALAHHPDAAPPPGLDAATADFARRLAHSQQGDLPPVGTQARIWAQVLDASGIAGSPSPNGRHTDHQIVEEMTMTTLATEPAHPASRRLSGVSITLIAAALAVILFSTWLIQAVNRPLANDAGVSPLPAIGALLQPTATPTPFPITTPLPTATMITLILEPTALPPMLVTVTASPLPNIEMLAPTVLPATPDSLAVNNIPPDALPLTAGEPVEGLLDAAQPSRTYSLVAQGGSLLDVEVEADAPIYLSNFSLTLPQPGAGNGGGGGGGGGPAQLFASTTIPIFEDSAVWITVSRGEETETARFRLTVTAATLPVIAYNEPVAVEAGPEDYHAFHFGYWQFEGIQGDIITVRAESADADLTLTLEGKSGEVFARDDDGGPGLNPEIYRFQLPYSGAYRLRVAPSDTWPALARFSVEVEQVEPLSLGNGPQTMHLNNKQAAWRLTYQAEANRPVTLVVDVTNVSGLPALFNVIAQQGGTTIGNVGTPTTTSSWEMQIVAPQDGPVTLYVNALFPGDAPENTSAFDLRMALEQP